MISDTAHRREFLAGMRAMVPWLVGVAPFGLVIGINAAQAESSALLGWLTGPLIYAGSAQAATIGMLDAGAAPLTIIVTVLVINVRLVLYSAAMATHWRGTPLWWRLLAGYLLIDPSFAVGVDGYADAQDRRRGHTHYLGGAVVLWATWLAAIAVGAAAGARIPSWLHLEFIVPLYLIGEVVPRLRRTVVRRSVLVTGAVALLCVGAPMHLGIAVAIVAGVAAASLTEPAPALPTTEAHR